MAHGRVLALALALVALTGSSRAQADAAPEKGAATVQVVMIQVDGDPTAVARTRAVTSELFARLGVASIVTSARDDEGDADRRTVLARAYFDLRDPAAASIVIVDGATEREIVRRRMPESPSLEMSVEELSHVFYSVVESLLTPPPAEPASASPAPAAPSSARTETPPPAPPVERAPPRPATHDEAPPFRKRVGPFVDGGAFFRLLALDSSRVPPGGGLSLRARARQNGAAFGGILMGAVHAPSDIGFGDAMGSVQVYSLRAYPTVSVPVSSRLGLDLGFGAGLDWFDVQQNQTPTGATPGDASTADFTLGSLLGARLDLGRSVSLDAALALDLDLTPRNFVIDRGTTRSTLLELSRFRPAVMVGASYGFAGSGAP